MLTVISKVIPILLLIGLGYITDKKRWLNDSTVNDFKKVVLNLSLPAVLFISFLNIKFKIEFLALTLTILGLCLTLYLIGVLLNNINYFKHPLLPFVSTGFTFGLLGISIYSSIFGNENVDKMAILGIGHEFFMWFLYYTFLKLKFTNEKFTIETLKNFIKSPLIIAIIAGITLNVTGIANYIHNNAVTQGVYLTLEELANTATPIILFIIGYGLKFNKKYMKQSSKFVITRFIIVLTVGMLVKKLIIEKFMSSDLLFDYAYFTFLILPPAFSLPIFVGEYSTDEHKELMSNTVVLHTVVFIIVYILFVIFINL